MLREHAADAHRDPALLLGADARRGVRRARLLLLVRRQRHLPEGDRPPGAPRASVPDELLLVETDSPYLSPQPVRGKPQRAGQRGRTTARVRRRAARHHLRRSSSARWSANAARVFGVVTGRSRARPASRRMRAVRRPAEPRARPELPDRRQHPRRDRRAAELGPADVVLEVGGGLGVLSEYLAAAGRRTSTWSRSTRALRAARCATRSTPFAERRRCTSPTRSKLDLGALDPRADEGRRQPALRRRGHGAAQVDRGAARGRGSGVAMVAARGGRAARGGARLRKPTARTSVLAQLSCEVRVAAQACRAPSSTRCRNVDSALVLLRRTAPAPPAEVRRPRARRASPTGARRWRARSRSRPARREAIRERAARGARARSAARRRARRAARAGAVRRAGASGSPSAGRIEPRGAIRERAPAKLNLVLHVGPPPRRRPARDLLAVRLARPGRRRCASSERRTQRRRGRAPGVEGENLAAARSRAFRERVGRRPAAARGRDRQAHPGRRRPRRRQRRRRRRRCARPTRIAGDPLDAGRRCASSARALGRRRARARSSRRHALVTGAGERVEPLDAAGDRGSSSCRAGRACRPARSTREADRIGSTRASGSTPTPLRELAAGRRPRWRPPLENDLEPAALSLRPELAGTARRAARGRRARGRRSAARVRRPSASSIGRPAEARAGRAACRSRSPRRPRSRQP